MSPPWTISRSAASRSPRKPDALAMRTGRFIVASRTRPRGAASTAMTLSHAEAVRSAVEPCERGGDEVHLQDAPVVEPRGSQRVQVLGDHRPGLLRELLHIPEHRRLA